MTSPSLSPTRLSPHIEYATHSLSNTSSDDGSGASGGPRSSITRRGSQRFDRIGAVKKVGKRLGYACDNAAKELGDIETSGTLTVIEPVLLLEKGQAWNERRDTQPLAVVFVGIPFRGKTHIAYRLCRWLNWKGAQSKVFNCGTFTTESPKLEPRTPVPGVIPVSEREALGEACRALIRYVETDGQVGILDATNHTESRRDMVRNTLQKSFPENRIIWIEIGTNNPDIISYHLRTAKLTRDVLACDVKIVEQKLIANSKSYESEYQPLGDAYNSLPVIKLKDNSIDFVNMNRTVLGRKLSYFLMHLKSKRARFYITCSGETENQRDKKLGVRNSSLTPRGRAYIKVIASFCSLEVADGADVNVWLSGLPSSYETAAALREMQNEGFFGTQKIHIRHWRELNELDYGSMEGASEDGRPAPVAPEAYWWAYPRGESYHDVNVRLEDVILSSEGSANPTIIVAHECVYNCLVAYFRAITPESCVEPLHNADDISIFYPQTKLAYHTLSIPSGYHELGSDLEVKKMVEGQLDELYRSIFLDQFNQALQEIETDDGVGFTSFEDAENAGELSFTSCLEQRLLWQAQLVIETCGARGAAVFTSLLEAHRSCVAMCGGLAALLNLAADGG